ncbi:hypothetical protein [Nocardia miyunensis]|uniref:hypothetical protein n=1 Tax=Nocardia miyunensis TaxID=282684 RepID=UPI0008337F2A|nr:hypothetical protein [Nocardia miyunensis]
MRTAVLRIDVDPARELTEARWARGMRALRDDAATFGAEILGDNAALPPRREVQMLVETGDADTSVREVVRLCAKAFGTEPVAAAVTYVSRGTDDDAHGVLAGFGLTAEVVREADAGGFDIVHITLRSADLERVPESRIHTALEAALNCEVRISTR